METKVLQVFYGKDCLPYKDKERSVHFPIVGAAIQGASNTTKIRFYFDELVNEDEETTSWVVVSKLPNGKIGSEIVETELDSELNEHYALFSLKNFYTQAKGDLFLSLQGYQGGVKVETDPDTGVSTILGTPTIQATGSIKLAINYATQLVGSGETSNITFQKILADLGTKLGIRAYTERVGELPTTGQTNVFYAIYDDPSNPNKLNIYVWNGTTQSYVWVGDNSLYLGDYYTKQEGEQFENDIDNRISSVESELSSVAQGSPKGVYDTLGDLQSAYPEGNNNIYIVLADGHWYYWNGSAWTDGGVYLSSLPDDKLNEESQNSVQNAVVTKLNDGKTYTPTLYQDKSLNDDGGLVNTTGFVAFEPIYLFKGAVINLDLSSQYRMMIRYWATALNSTQCVRIFHKVGKYVCPNNGYYGVFFISAPNSSTGVTTTEIGNALRVYYDGNAQNNEKIDALNNGIYGHTYKLGYNQDGYIDSQNNFTSATGHVGVLATYFYKGTVFNFDSSKYNVYLRYFGKEFTQGSSNLKQIGLINGGYKIEDEGFYSIGFNTAGNQGITIDTIEKNIFIEKPNYLTNEDGLVPKTSIDTSEIEIIPTNTRNARVLIPFKFGYGCHIICSENSDLQAMIYLYKNGVQVNDDATFGMTWAKEQYMLAISNCDTIEIRFRLYDGTSVKYLEESDKTVIKNAIYSLYCGTHQLTTDLGITKNNLDATIKGLMNSNKTTISINHQGYNHYSLRSGYKITAQKGFQYGECDVKQTSDGVFVCCHDNSFVDENTQQTIVIAQHTWAELQTYNYHGEKIASLDELLHDCKIYGVGLMIDHLSANIIAGIMPLVKKHNMERSVLWSISDTINGITAEVEAIVALDPKAEMITAFQTLTSSQLEELNSLQEQYPLCHLIASVNHTQYSVDDFVEMKMSLNAGIDVGVWTIDKVGEIIKYLPYARYFTSNKVSYRMIIESGILY